MSHDREEYSLTRITSVTDERYLVVAAKNGDTYAYEELCRRHSRQILRTALRITRNVADAEDARQEALLNAYTHLNSFDGRSAFSSWLTRIAINSSLMILRKKRTHFTYSLTVNSEEEDLQIPDPRDTALDPEELLLLQAMNAEFSRALRLLSPRLRPVLQIWYQDDASLAEIASILGISEAAVKSRLFRAKSNIRRYFYRRYARNTAATSISKDHGPI